MGIQAVLFDMDGVLVDSEPVIRAAAVAGLREYGVPAVEEDFIPFTGMGEDRFIGGVAEKYGHPYQLDMKTRVYDIYGTVVDRDLITYPAALPALQALRARGLKLALASSADHVKIAHNLRVARIPREAFDALIGGNDIERKKPYPDIYLLAAKLVGIDPAECVVVEDALSGVAAGLAAGARVLGVTTSFSAEVLIGAGASAVVADISEVPEAIARLCIG